jgi:anti-sigma-K factor RskA
VEYTADFANKIDRMIEKQTALEVAIGELRASIMPRHEIDAEIEKRVPLTTYASDRLNFEERFKRLEEAPSATWARAGILISGGIGCLSLLVASTSILVSILIAAHVIG